MNNYNETIYCDDESTVLGDIKYTNLYTRKFDINRPTDPYIRYTETRYIPKFAYYKNDTIIGKSLEWYGEYTELELQLLRNFIKPNFIVYDIGANIGYHTVGFAKSTKHVYAFEPNKKNLKLLHNNTKQLNNVTVFDVACSDGNTDMYVEDFDLDIPGNYGEMHMRETGQLCNSRRIDDIDDIYAPDLIKIDVEGHELQVLRGSLETITEYKPIIFYEAHGNDLDDIYTLLDNLGYKLYWFPCSNYYKNNHKRCETNVFGNGGVLNILALHGYPKINNLLPVRQNESYQVCVENYLKSLQENNNVQQEAKN
jgi:FkbM family methyltransferase